VAELFESKDGYHCHGMIDYDTKFDEPGVVGFDVMEVMTESYQIASAARKKGVRHRVAFNRYDKKKAGGRYCAKYMTKAYHDFDMM